MIDNADRGMPLLVLMIMAQLVFSGGPFSVHGRPGLEQLAWLAPSRWAFAMTAATTDLSRLSPADPDPLWTHTTAHWLIAATILAAMATTRTVLVIRRIIKLDPQRRG